MTEPFLWGSPIDPPAGVYDSHVTILRNGTFLLIGKVGTTPADLRLKAWIYNADGSLRGEKVLESEYYGGFWDNIVDQAGNPLAVELPDGGIALTWSLATSSPGHRGAWIGLYGNDLEPLGKPIPVAGLHTAPYGHAGNYKADDAIGLADGTVVVTYRSLSGEAFLRVVSPDSTLLNPVSLGPTLASDDFADFESVIDLTALPGGKVVAAVRTSATENKIYILDSASLAGTADPVEISIPIVASIGITALEVTALEGGGFVVTWVESGKIAAPPAESEPSVTVRFQIYNASGEPVGEEPFVFYESTREAVAIGTPDVVALSSGGFALAAQVVQGLDPDRSEVRLATFTGAGERVSTKLLVSKPATDGEFSLHGLSMLADGRIIVHLSNGIQIVDPRGEAVVLTGTVRDDQYIGTSFDDTMDGGSGDDSLDGVAGNDLLRGGDGHDTLHGGAGADRLDGGDGIDFVSFVNAKAGVTASLSGGTGGDAAGDIYTSIEGLIGSSFDDVFTGNGAAILRGGAGNDTYYVSVGDVVEEAANGGRDTVIVGGSYSLSAGAEVEVLRLSGVSSKTSAHLTGSDTANEIHGHAGANTLRGMGGNDVLKAGSGNDRVYGDAGNDTLYGGAGNDRLYGGKGKDIIVFDTKPNKKTNVDRIYDFNPKDDTIWLDNAVFTKLGKGTPSKPVKFKSDMFVKGKAAKDREDRIVYDNKTGALYYDQDGTGSKAQVKIATLNKNLKLTHSDFFVI